MTELALYDEQGQHVLTLNAEGLPLDVAGNRIAFKPWRPSAPAGPLFTRTDEQSGPEDGLPAVLYADVPVRLTVELYRERLVVLEPRPAS